MQEWSDVFDYKKLPGWSNSQPVKTIEVVPSDARPKWLSIVAGVGVGFGALFLAQLLFAIASHDLKGHRARAIDTGTAASVMGSIALGVVAWRWWSENR